jgi:single-strand DNA-binding protein
MYLNRATIIGNLTRDPELKSLPSGILVGKVSIATNRKWKDKNDKVQEAVEFHNCVVFGKMAETIAQWCKKGHQILIEGRLQTRTWEAPDKTNRYATEIVIESFQFGAKPQGTSVAAKTETQATSEPARLSEIEYPEEDINPEDIPF